MSRKVKTAKEIVLECCEGSRTATPFFAGLNDDAYVGYQTGVIKILNPNIQANPQELYNLIYQMLKNGELK